MKDLAKNFVAAFSTYSKIPMPRIEFDDDNIRYSLCCFPFIGVVIGILFLCWYNLCSFLGLSPALFGAVSVFIPIAVTGGIHLDGLIDTADAVNSYADKQKKLEILKDPHVGAFAVIMLCVYLILQYALFQQLYEDSALIFFVFAGYVASRCLSGLTIVVFEPAKNTGFAHIFSHKASKKIVTAVLVVYLLMLVAVLVFVSFVWSMLSIFSVTILFFVYRKKIHSLFGGITGDLSGCLLQLVEILFLAIAVAGGICLR